VLSVAILLALAAFTPTSPVASVTSGAAVATCFSPEKNCTAFAVDAIDAAEHQILAIAYGLTIGSGIVETLVRAKHRVVDVKLIEDKTNLASGEAGSTP